MALSQDEQRMLAEIERRLAADDPGLATSLTSFRRPGPGSVLRSPRARIIGSLFTVLLVAMISLMFYAMIPFRTHMNRPVSPSATAGAPSHTAISAVTHQPNAGQQSSAGTGVKSAAGQPAAGHSTGSTATGKQQATIKPTNGTMLSEAP
jgi:hypothetical protein